MSMMPPGTVTPARAARTTRATPTKVAPGVVTASQSEDEHILTGMPSGSTTHSSDASGSKEVSGSEGFSGSEEASAQATTSKSSSCYEANSADCTQATLTRVPTLVSDQPNRWCVEGKFQVYSKAKLPNDKGFITRTLTLERRVLTGSLPTMPVIHTLFTRHRLD